jgi:putative DNA primase/helicase
VETSPFARADLEYDLLLVDDDMKMEALPQTNIIKSLVTAEMPMDLEKKGKQSYQGTMYVRLLGFGNGTLKSLYDRSVGFFRRQIILMVKDRPKDRLDDPFLSEKLCGEIEGILLWALEGLHRLQTNNYRFTISERSRESMQESMTESNNVIEFLKSEGYIGFKAEHDISSQRLYELYELWCEDNADKPLSRRSFCLQMAALAGEYNLEPTNKVQAHGRQVRGYVGIYSLLP